MPPISPFSLINTLFTPVLRIETANSAHYAVCLTFVNASSSDRNGTLEILTLDGTVISYGSYSPTPAGGGTGIEVSVFQSANPNVILYGKITVDGPPDSIRANLSLIDSKRNTLVSLDAR